MYLCRALQRISPLTRHSMTHQAILHRDVVPRRLMSSVPGSSGENLFYALICGGAFAAASAYAYRTVSMDGARFTDRITEIEARPKNEWKPKPWPPQSAEAAGEVAEVESPAEAVTKVIAEAKKNEPSSVAGKVAEMVAETAEAVAEVAATVVEEVAEEVEKMEVAAAAAKELKSPVLPVAKEATAEINEATFETFEENSVEEAPVTPAEEDVPVSLTVAASEDEFSAEGQVLAEEPKLEFKHDYYIVVLDGAPKSDKKHKVLGVSPIIGNIIPAPEDEEPAEQITEVML